MPNTGFKTLLFTSFQLRLQNYSIFPARQSPFVKFFLSACRFNTFNQKYPKYSQSTQTIFLETTQSPQDAKPLTQNILQGVTR